MGTTKNRKGPEYDGSKPLENPKQDLFCYLFVGYHNKNLFGNGAQSYVEAYEYGERVREINLKLSKIGSGTKEYRKLAGERKAILSGAASSASRMLINVNIRKRLDYLLEELIATDDAVDRESKYVILQREDLPSKVAMIREYNRVKGRVKESTIGPITITWEGAPVKKK